MLGGVVGFSGHHGLAVRIGTLHECEFRCIAASPDISITGTHATITKIYAPVERARSRLRRLDDDLRIRVPLDPFQHQLHGGKVSRRANLLAEVCLQMTLRLNQVPRGVEDMA